LASIFFRFSVVVYCLFIAGSAWAQGDISGGLQLRNDYYIRDVKRGAAGIPHYDNLKSSVDGWFDLAYCQYFSETRQQLIFQRRHSS
jgi:hypothetical protein